MPNFIFSTCLLILATGGVSDLAHAEPKPTENTRSAHQASLTPPAQTMALLEWLGSHEEDELNAWDEAMDTLEKETHEKQTHKKQTHIDKTKPGLAKSTGKQQNITGVQP